LYAGVVFFLAVISLNAIESGNAGATEYFLRFHRHDGGSVRGVFFIALFSESVVIGMVDFRGRFFECFSGAIPCCGVYRAGKCRVLYPCS